MWWAIITMSPPLARNWTAATATGVDDVIAPISMSSEMIAPLKPTSVLSIRMVTGERSAEWTVSSTG